MDLYCGWDQYELSKDMQTHYAGQQRSHRVRRCAITQSISFDGRAYARVALGDACRRAAGGARPFF